MLKLATKFKPRPEAFQRAESAGFEFAEIWLSLQLVDRMDELVAIAETSNLQFALHFPNKGRFDRALLRRATELYQAVSASAMVIHQPMFEQNGALFEAIPPDVRLGIENHDLDFAGFNRWAESSCWLTLDVEHLWMHTLGNCGLDQLLDFVGEFLSSYGEKLVHVHLPGYLPGHTEHRPMYCSRDMVLSVFALLADLGFQGLVVSEVNPQYQNPNELRMDVLLFEHWRQLYLGDKSRTQLRTLVA